MAYSNYIGRLLAETHSSSSTSYATAAGQVLVGSGANETFVDHAGGAVMSGGLGDDRYYVIDPNSVVQEAVNGGVDTVFAYVSVTLGDNVENLSISGSSVTGRGNGLDNIIYAKGTNDVVIGGAGNDVLVDMGLGSNRFIFSKGDGQDVVMGFLATGANHDAIGLSGQGLNSFAQIQSHMTQVGADVLIQSSASDAVLIKNTQMASLTAADFLLPLDRSHLKLTFDDEFNTLSLYNAASGTGVWKTNYKSGAQSGANVIDSHTLRSNGELQVYVDPSFTGTGHTALGLDPFSVSNGVLTIAAHKTPGADLSVLGNYGYTSGMLSTEKSFAQTYGYFEMRAELPVGQGAWPAFWMLPADGSWPPELDIMEQINGGSLVYQTEHTRQTGAITAKSTATNVADATSAYHTYGLLWTQDSLTWYIDGVATTSMATPADMNKPMYMIANLAIGGSWAGAPNADFASAQMQVDYIRAYGLSTDPGPTGAPVGAVGADHALTSLIPPDAGPAASSSAAVGSLASTASTTDVTANHIYGTSGNDVLTGTAGADVIDGGKGADVMTGGAGDDIYYVDGQADRVIEAAGGGNDTVVSGATYTLPDNVENLILRYTGNAAGNGNALDNHITGNSGDNILDGKGGNDVIDGGAGNDVIIGGAGNDILTGGAGTDTFRFAKWSGNDVVTDFGVGGHDVIDISAWLRSGIAPTLQDNANGVAIMFRSGDSIELLGVHAHDLITTNLGYSI